MVNKSLKINTLLIFLIMIVFSSCLGQHFFEKDKNGEPILDLKLYTLNKEMDKEDSKIIDTTALYVEYYEMDDLKNPEILIFHNDGFFESTSKQYFRKFSNQRFRNSVYYGGKFIIEQNKIKIESFCPVSGGKTNYFRKTISKGSINSDTLKISIFNYERVYIRRSYSEVFS